jgi:hypothetical protein
MYDLKDKKKKMQMGGMTDPAMKTGMSFVGPKKKPEGMMYGGMAAKKPKKMQAGGRVYAPSRKPART